MQSIILTNLLGSFDTRHTNHKHKSLLLLHKGTPPCCLWSNVPWRGHKKLHYHPAASDQMLWGHGFSFRCFAWGMACQNKLSSKNMKNMEGRNPPSRIWHVVYIKYPRIIFPSQNFPNLLLSSTEKNCWKRKNIGLFRNLGSQSYSPALACCVETQPAFWRFWVVDGPPRPPDGP